MNEYYFCRRSNNRVPGLSWELADVKAVKVVTEKNKKIGRVGQTDVKLFSFGYHATWFLRTWIFKNSENLYL